MQKPIAPNKPSVTFCEVHEEDLALLFSLRRDPALQTLLLTVPDALDDASLKGWVARRQQEPGGLFRIVRDASCGDAIGFVQISQVHRRNRIGYLGLCIATDARGRGLGQATLRTLIETSRTELGLFKLLSEVRVDNFPALRCHLSLGFHIVGTLKAHFLDSEGVRHDVLFLERLLDGD